MHEFLRSLARPAETKIVLLSMDGLGGLPREPGGGTELETAKKPNLDALAARSALGLLDPVAPGVTPGSGPGHLALFGFDPEKHNVGRGMLSAFGIGFDVQPGDVAFRGNFATIGADGKLTDRRAGRLATAKCAELAGELERKIPEINGVRVFVRPEKDYRFVLAFRGPGLGSDVTDTDPQKEGAAILEAHGSDPTARLANEFTRRSLEVLRNRVPANAVLLRGCERRPDLPSLAELYGIRPAAVATYPMYRGLARLVGMEILKTSEEEDLDLLARVLAENWSRFDFFFVHVKKTDSAGEDGDFDRKVHVVEDVDRRLIPKILALSPDVFALSSDHSTPAVMKAHSWHPVPLLLGSRGVRSTGEARFGETACARGTLGRMPSSRLMSLLLAHAGRLSKFGA